MDRTQTTRRQRFVSWLGVVTWVLLGVVSGWAQTPAVPTTIDDASAAGEAAGSPRALYRQAHADFTAGRIDQAWTTAIGVFRQGHRSVNLLNLLAAIELKAGRQAIAGLWLKKALCFDPGDSTARRLLAQMPPSPRPVPLRPNQTREHLDEISRQLPELLSRLNNPQTFARRILEELQFGRFYHALALAEEYEKRHPGPEAQGLSALAAMFLGQNREALAMAGNALKTAPDQPIAATVVAMLTDTNPLSSTSSNARSAYDRDRFGEAIAAANRLVQIDARSAEGNLVLARIALDRLDMATADKQLAEALKRDPDHPLAHLYNVELAMNTNNASAAARSLDFAWRRGYNLPSVRLRAGLVALAGGRVTEARQILADCQQMMPFVDRDAWPLCVQLGINVDPAHVRNVLKTWRERLGTTALSCYYEALIERNANNMERAVALIKQGMAANPDLIAPLPAVSLIANLAGDAELARAVLERVVAARPDDQELRRQLSMLTTKVSTEASMDKRDTGPFTVEHPSELSSALLDAVLAMLNRTYGDLTRLFGISPKPVPVRLVVTPGAGDRIALFDRASGKLTLSVILGDADGMAKLVADMYPEVANSEQKAFGEQFARHTLFHEFSHLLVGKALEGVKPTGIQATWLHEGLAEVIGGESSVLSVRLKRLQQARRDGKYKILAPPALNALLTATKASPVELEGAYAQSYLMVSHLLKKSGGLLVGLSLLIEAIRQQETGKSLSETLTNIYQENAEVFAQSWQEAGEPCIEKGQPFTW